MLTQEEIGSVEKAVEDATGEGVGTTGTTITVLSDVLGPMDGLYWGPLPEREAIERFVRLSWPKNP